MFRVAQLLSTRSSSAFKLTNKVYQLSKRVLPNVISRPLALGFLDHT